MCYTNYSISHMYCTFSMYHSLPVLYLCTSSRFDFASSYLPHSILFSSLGFVSFPSRPTYICVFPCHCCELSIVGFYLYFQCRLLASTFRLLSSRSSYPIYLLANPALSPPFQIRLLASQPNTAQHNATVHAPSYTPTFAQSKPPVLP